MTRHVERRQPLRPEQHEAAGERMAIWIGLARMRRGLLRVVERRLKRAGLPPLLWHDALHLLVIQPSGELSAPELERRLVLRQYQVSRLIDALAESGCVMRRRLPVVGRTMLVQLTARGRNLQQRMAEVYASVVDAEITGQFTEQEADVLVELSKRFDLPSSASKGNERSKILRRFNPETYRSGAPAELAE
jgi:DNA-binding MarR family transcriptional regulator